MAKATVDNLVALGFQTEQFGAPDDFDTNSEGGYLFDVLTDSALEVEDKVGTENYEAASSSSVEFEYIKKAELYFSAAELYRRREIFDDANVRVGSQDSDPKIQSRYLKRADDYEVLANSYLAKLGTLFSTSSVSVGNVQTGHFAGV